MTTAAPTVVSTAPALWIPVAFRDHSGTRQKLRLQVKPAPATIHERVALGALMNELAIATRDDRDEAAKAVIRDRVIGWTEIVDDDDRPVPFTPENLDAVMADWRLLTAACSAVIADVRKRTRKMIRRKRARP